MSILRLLGTAGVLAAGVAFATPADAAPVPAKILPLADVYVDFGVGSGCGCGPVVVQPAPVYYAPRYYAPRYYAPAYYAPTYYAPSYYVPRSYGYAYYRPRVSTYVGLGFSSHHGHGHRAYYGHHGSRRSLSGHRVIGRRR
jgi:hypothetical protein